MRKVGVIGGFGPETTAKFYLEVVFGCQKRNKEHRPLILICNVPIKFHIEEDLILRGTGEERFLPFLTEAAKILEKGGADFLVMPCNSLDAFIEEIRESVRIPVLSIIEETGKFLKKKGAEKVGILASPSSLKKKLHKKSFEKFGIETIDPGDSDTTKLGEIINKAVLNTHTQEDTESLIQMINKLEVRWIQDVVLACTDLKLLIQQHNKLSIHDTMKILAEATIEEILK